MAQTIMDLFKDKKGELYGLAGTALIESRGILDVKRQAALLLSSPNSVADLIGSAASQVIGGSANRPTDTIFRNNQPLSKPVSVVPTRNELLNAIEPDKAYFIKGAPSPGAEIAKIVQNAVQSPGAAQSAAMMAINKFGGRGAKKEFNKFVDKLKGAADETNYGPKLAKDQNGKLKKDAITYTTHTPYFEKVEGKNDYVRTKLVERELKGEAKKSQWDLVNEEILKVSNAPDDKTYNNQLNNIDKKNKELNQTYLKIKQYGKGENKTIILPGTITGISEDFAPEINQFKYVGSPFNLYKYSGIERTLKFNIKMYYLDHNTKLSMIKNLNNLRKLVFPDEDISVVQYSNNSYSPLFFTPNLIKLTINGVYTDVLGIVDALGFTIDDNVPWVTTDEMLNNTLDGSINKKYPSVIDVSFGMKIIENPAIKDNKYLFDTSTEPENRYVNYFTDKTPILSNMERTALQNNLNEEVAPPIED